MLFDITKTVLLEIDVQNDFCPAYTAASEEYPAGALAVQDGCAVVEPLNALARAFTAAGGRAAATQDWHPAGHISFASAHTGKKAGDTVECAGAGKQALWPDHCVQGSTGAAFHAALDLRPVSLIVRKGARQGLDSYSAFFENDRTSSTGLEGWLKRLGIATVVIGGLATDYCVLYSALDAQRLGFTTIIADDAVRGVGYPQGSIEKAVETMKAAGIVFAAVDELLAGLRS
jgi:nicotinamidase/pyrazinamidase